MRQFRKMVELTFMAEWKKTPIGYEGADFKAKPPYITLTIQPEQVIRGIDGNSGMVTGQLIVTCYADTPSQLEELEMAVDTFVFQKIPDCGGQVSMGLIGTLGTGTIYRETAYDYINSFC